MPSTPFLWQIMIETASTPSIIAPLSYAHFEQMAALEQKYYGADFITPAKEAYRWYCAHAYTTTAAAVNDEVIAFANLFPIQSTAFEKLLSGQLNDSELTAESIADIHADDDPLHMFLSCILVEPAYRHTGLTRKLLQAAIEPYLPVQHRCQLIATDNITPEGITFSRHFGFSAHGISGHGSQLFVQPFSRFISKVYSSLT